MQALEKICEILSLKRKSIEREIAALDSQIKSIDLQLAEIDMQQKQMTTEIYSKKMTEAAIGDFRWLESWKSKLVYTIGRLNEIKAGIIAARAPKQEELTRIIVKEDILNQKRLTFVKQQANRRAEDQSSERLETWVNKHIL